MISNQTFTLYSFQFSSLSGMDPANFKNKMVFAKLFFRAKMFLLSFFYFLNQPWPTQIGSRATFLKNGHFEGQNLAFFLNSNRFCFKIAFFRVCRRAALESFKGRGLAMAVLNYQKIKIGGKKLT
jgi:hypothetical protein